MRLELGVDEVEVGQRDIEQTPAKTMYINSFILDNLPRTFLLKIVKMYIIDFHKF